MNLWKQELGQASIRTLSTVPPASEPWRVKEHLNRRCSETSHNKRRRKKGVFFLSFFLVVVNLMMFRVTLRKKKATSDLSSL